MICPECNFNQKYNDGMRCRRCKYKFTLNPKDDKTSDLKFSKAISAASMNDTAYFTFNQFYVAFAKLNKFKPLNNINVLLILGALVGFITYSLEHSVVPTIIMSTLVVVLGYFGLFITHTLPDYKHTEKLFIKWTQEKRHTIEKLVHEPTLHKPPAAPIDQDLYDYGVEAVIFVDKDLYVDLFVLNDIHTDLRALVISQNGYPDYLKVTCERILQNNELTPIYVIHDGYSSGKEMIDHIRITYQINDREIFDLGLFEQDFSEVKRFTSFVNVPRKPLDILSKNEIVNLLSVSLRDQISIAASAAVIYPHDDPSYGSFG